MRSEFSAHQDMSQHAAALQAERARWAAVLGKPSRKPAQARKPARGLLSRIFGR